MAPGTLLGFPTQRQLADFTKHREAGTISVFRARRCDVCQKEIPEAFRCCGQQCHDKLNPPKKAP